VALCSVEPRSPYRTTFVTHGIQALLGCTPAECVASTSFWTERAHPEDLPELIRQFDDLHESGQRSFESRFRRNDGLYRWLRGELRLIRNAAGEPTELVGFWADVSEQRRAEDALRASEERYRELFENANDVVFTTDLDLNFTSLNQAAKNVTGYSSEEALAINVDRIVPREYVDRLHSRLRDHLAGKLVPMLEIEVVTKDGHRVPLEINTRLMHRAGRPVGIQGIARDISERRALEAQVRQAQKMEAVGQLAGGIAHDFNNLLTVILGCGEQLAGRLAPENPDGVWVSTICDAALRAAELTRQLLAFSRRQVLAPRAVDLNGAIAGIGRMIARIISEDIQLVTALAPDLRSTKADPSQIEQIIMNLVVNARDAMPDGGRLTISTANTVLDDKYVADHPGSQPGSYVMLAVGDTGAGMDAATQARIFEPFFTTKELGKGTGLGLSTVYGIVKQSGGYIWVDSQPGAGSVFKVYLLAADDNSGIGVRRAGDSGAVDGSTMIPPIKDDGVGAASEELTATPFSTLTGRGMLEAHQQDTRNKEIQP